LFATTTIEPGIERDKEICCLHDPCGLRFKCDNEIVVRCDGLAHLKESSRKNFHFGILEGKISFTERFLSLPNLQSQPSSPPLQSISDLITIKHDEDPHPVAIGGEHSGIGG
jgi:hypothetical protein